MRSISGCNRCGLLLHSGCSTEITKRLLPADHLAVHGGFVRLIRPMLVVRLVSTLLGVAVCVPISAVQADAAQRRPAVSRRTPTATKKKITAYSATASRARKTSLAHARASARAREVARLRSLQQLQEAMTPQFKTDAAGQTIPDVRA